MRILVGCEESGVVRDAFARRGHEAWSNDLFYPARNGGNHLQMDVHEAIVDHGPWDIIIIHPDCTGMCVSGNKHYAEGKPKHAIRLHQVRWTEALWDLTKKHALVGAAMENPQSVLWPFLGVVPQYIQPYQFGHPEQKNTGILTDRLPRLIETKNVYAEMMLLPKNVRERVFHMVPGPDRAKMRSETFWGIGDAMAEQWGSLMPVLAQAAE